MNTTPGNDAPRWQAGAGVKQADTTQDYVASITLDCLTVYVIAGAVRFPEARALVKLLTPDLFADPASRRVMALMKSDSPFSADPLQGLTRSERDRARRLAGAAAASEIPDSPEWAVSLVRFQAEKRFGPLLAAQLEWGARELRAGRPVRFVLSRVNAAVTVALGIAPFDPTAGWEEAA